MKKLTVALICSLAAALSGLLYFRRRYFILYQNIQESLKAVLQGEEMMAVTPTEGSEAVLQELLIRISKKYQRESDLALKEKETVQGLISDLSHQLKTPLSNIRLYQELLKTPDLTSQKRSQLEKRLDELTDKLDWLLHALFQMVDLERGVVSLTAVSAPIVHTIQKAVETVLPKADQKDISFQMEACPQMSIFYDPRWTEEIFINILENAVKYAPEGSAVRISFEAYETYGDPRSGSRHSQRRIQPYFPEVLQGKHSGGKRRMGDRPLSRKIDR